MVRACKICGKWFNSTSKNNTLCSLECRAVAKRERVAASKHKKAQLAKYKPTGNREKIINLNAEAKALGMSYGRYVAMKEGK